MKEILVHGHQKPDTDSIASAIAFAHFLREKGKDAEAVALGEVSAETAYALDEFSLEAPRIIESAKGEGEKLALVDHNEFQQSVKDIEEMEIYSVVDHHKIANFETPGPVFYRAEPLGCTCSIIYKLYKENGISIPRDIAGIMVSAIISDTLLFNSPTCTEEDEEIAKDLAEIAGLNLKEYGLNLLKAGADVSGKSSEEILEGDAKTFEFEELKFRIGQVNVVDHDDVLDMKKELIEAMDSFVEAEGYGAYLLIVTDILTSDSVGLVRGEKSGEIAEIFGQSLEDNEFDMDGVVSRKKQVVPPITERYS